MRNRTIKIITLFCMLAIACVEPFDLKNIRYTKALVVEGHISTINRPQQIKLSRTAALNERTFIAESGADVTVENESGEKIQFNEVKPGIYESSSFAGVVGEGYTLSITTSNGRKYKSQQVVLKDGPPIGKIYAEFVTEPERGIKISVDTEDPLNKTHFYRWDYVETFEIRTPYESNYVVLPGANEATWRYDRVDHCWGNDTLREVKIKSTIKQDEDKVIAFPLRFISERSYIFRIKYSMLVQQYALSEDAYNYWENIRIFNETQGALADVQPGILIGNVFGVTDPSETVLGYFDASAISEQRVFFDYKDFTPVGYERPGFRTDCYEIIPTFVLESEIAEYMLTRSKDYAIWDVVGSSPNAQFEVFPIGCCDCSNMGTTIKPSFWE
jgi:hypothetical protein